MQPVLGGDFNSRWLGIANAPQQQSFFFEVPNKTKKTTLGGVVINENSFISNRLLFLAQYSFRIQLGSKIELRLGLHAGSENYHIKFEDLQSVDTITLDPILKEQSFFQPHVGVGAFFKIKNYFISLAIPQLIQNESLKASNAVALSSRFNYLFRIGWERKLSSSWLIQFSTMVNNLNWSTTTFQYQGCIDHKFGAFFFSYQTPKIMGVGIRVRDNQFISIGYHYQFSINPRESLSIKNHSLSLLFRLGKNQ